MAGKSQGYPKEESVIAVDTDVPQEEWQTHGFSVRNMP